MFGRLPTVKYHVEYMLKKAKRKLWTLRHIKRAGLKENDLLTAFNTLMRPTLEFAVPTYHPMLDIGMCDRIESVQKRAAKLIFGWNSNYDTLVQSGKIVPLKTRREELTLKFAKKAAESERFAAWFTEKSYENVNIREKNRKRYEERFARTERLKKSPLFYMTRMLNNETCEKRPM